MKKHLARSHTTPGQSSETLELLDRARHGDREAAALLYEKHRSAFLRIARQELRPALRAKLDPVDLVQSVEADILNGRVRAKKIFADLDRCISYFKTMTRNYTRDVNRHYLCRKTDVVREAPDHMDGLIDVRHDGPFTKASIRDEFRQALALLPSMSRYVVVYFRTGRSLAEICLLTELSPRRVRERFASAQSVFCQAILASPGARGKKEPQRGNALGASGHFTRTPLPLGHTDAFSCTGSCG